VVTSWWWLRSLVFAVWLKEEWWDVKCRVCPCRVYLVFVIRVAYCLVLIVAWLK
jgi:hypothetical protein